MNLTSARVALDLIVAKANELGVQVSCCIADDAANEILSARMDGAALFTSHIARGKARTAALLRMDTTAVGDLLGRHPELEPLIAQTASFPLTTLGGGVAVRDGDRFVGAIACSGATPEQDIECARAGTSALLTDS